MAAKQGMTVSIRIEGLTATLAQFNKMGDSKALGNDYLRIGSAQIAADMVGWSQSAARSVGRQAAVFAPFIKVKNDRVPVVQVSPTGKLFKGSSTAGSTSTFRPLAGSEFGASKTGKYGPHGFQAYLPSPTGHGGAGRWFFPTARAHQTEVAARWNEVAAAIIEAFNEGNLK